MERLTTHTHTYECRWFIGEPWQRGHNRQKCICGTAWRLNGTKWAIIQNSMLGPELKRGFPPACWARGLRGRGCPTSAAFDGVLTSGLPPLPPVPRPPPCGFFLFLLFLLLPARTYSHTVTRKNLGPFLLWLGPLFRHKDTKQLYGTGDSNGNSNGLWRALFTHSRDTSNYTGPPLFCPPAPLRLSWEDAYQCEEVTSGNANSIWGACTLAVHLQHGICGNKQWAGAGVFRNN